MENTVSFLTDKEQYDALEQAKFFLQKSKGDILREALSDYLNKNFPKDIQKKVQQLLKNK